MRVERHFLVGDALEQRLDLRGARAGRDRGRCGARRCASRRRRRRCGRAGRSRKCASDRCRARRRSRRASGVTVVPLASFAGPKFRSGVRTSWNGSIGAARRAASASNATAAGVAAGTERGGADGRFWWRACRRSAPLRPPPEITATTAPTLATSPTWKWISVSVPPVVDGTSIEVLSVSISNRLSPGFTASPADLNHFVILPSATVSPSCGIRTSTVLPSNSADCRYQLTDTYCVSRNSFMPSCAPSRPRPDCFVPPNGAAGSETRPRLRPIMPKSSFSDTRMPRLRSFV